MRLGCGYYSLSGFHDCPAVGRFAGCGWGAAVTMGSLDTCGASGTCITLAGCFCKKTARHDGTHLRLQPILAADRSKT
eukprot:5926276-Karenia_brevis.AAC.1